MVIISSHSSTSNLTKASSTQGATLQGLKDASTRRRRRHTCILPKWASLRCLRQVATPDSSISSNVLVRDNQVTITTSSIPSNNKCRDSTRATHTTRSRVIHIMETNNSNSSTWRTCNNILIRLRCRGTKWRSITCKLNMVITPTSNRDSLTRWDLPTAWATRGKVSSITAQGATPT